MGLDDISRACISPPNPTHLQKVHDVDKLDNKVLLDDDAREDVSSRREDILLHEVGLHRDRSVKGERKRVPECVATEILAVSNRVRRCAVSRLVFDQEVLPGGGE